MARVAALLVALSPPLFVNAAAWGQFDALLSLFVVAAIVAALNGRTVGAGAALGLGLATKLLAVVAAPVLALWTWRRRGTRALLAGTAAVLSAVVLTAAPYAVRGASRSVLASYHGAVGYYPLRTVEAYNLWYVLDRRHRLRGQPPASTRGHAPVPPTPDASRRGPGPGRGLDHVHTAGLWRWPGDASDLAAAFRFFACFLPTQMPALHPARGTPGAGGPLSRRVHACCSSSSP